MATVATPGPRTTWPVLAFLAGVGWCVSAGWCVGETPLEPEDTPVFEVQDLFKSVRIPNIVVANDATVLAFAKSGRLLRRSEDGGRTFSPVQEVGHDAAGSAIVDRRTGDVMVVNSGAGHLWRSGDHFPSRRERPLCRSAAQFRRMPR